MVEIFGSYPNSYEKHWDDALTMMGGEVSLSFSLLLFSSRFQLSPLEFLDFFESRFFHFLEFLDFLGFLASLIFLSFHSARLLMFSFSYLSSASLPLRLSPLSSLLSILSFQYLNFVQAAKMMGHPKDFEFDKSRVPYCTLQMLNVNTDNK